MDAIRVFPDGLRPTPHLVHYAGRPRGWTPLPEGVGSTAMERFSQILSSGRLRAFPVVGTSTIPVVCASDTSPADLEAAFRTGLNTRGRSEPWALVLDREQMWTAGARPVLYASNADAYTPQKALAEKSERKEALVQRLDPVGIRSDWTHEREWRWIPSVDRDDLPAWPQLHAVIVGQVGWQPLDLDKHPDAARVERWLWNGQHLLRDGMITDAAATP